MLKNIKIIGAVLTLGLLLNSCDIEKEKSIATNNVVAENIVNKDMEVLEDDLTIFVATDLHYLSNSINDKGEAYDKLVENLDGRQINYINDILDAFAYEVKTHEPDVLIVSGDLTHNGELASHKDLAKMFSEIESYGTEVFVTTGNHDINNPWARGFEGDKEVKVDSVTKEEFKNIYSDFGFEDVYARDKNSLSYVAEVSDDLWLLMLDTSIYNKNKSHPITNGRVSKKTLQWIKEISKDAKEKDVEILTSMHHNLYNHSDLLYKGFTLDNNVEVHEVFEEESLNLVLSGHIHIQDIMADENNSVYDVVTSALTIYPIQYGVINYSKEEGFEYFTRLVDIEKWAADNNITDKNLLNFEEYSREYFYKDSFNHVYSSLMEEGVYTEEEASQMADVMSTLNIHYFGGNTPKIYDEIITSEGYKLWKNKELDFLSYYVLSMVQNKDVEHNFLKIHKKQ